MYDISQLINTISLFIKDNVIEPIKDMTLVDYIDVCVLTLAIYMVIIFVRNRRAGKLATGVLLIIAAFIVTEAVDMHAMKFILQNFYQVGIIAIIVIFQDDLRAALEKVGGISSKLVSTISEGEKHSDKEVETAIAQICKAVFAMSEEKTGALIVIERDTKLGNYMDSGVALDAELTSSLLCNIFFNKAPLHDGAVIIRNLRIGAAGCKLPLTAKEIGVNLGTRHRAAVGLSEVASDALVIVVSEETGTVSLCCNGVLERGFIYNTLLWKLREKFGYDKEKQKKGRRLREKTRQRTGKDV